VAQGGGRELANMLIDSEGTVIPGGEAFKRKLNEGKMMEDMEKVRVVEGIAQGYAESSQWAVVAVQPHQGQ